MIKEVIARLCSYRPYIKLSVNISPVHLGLISTLELDIRADMKTAVL